jgi:hypothetical protein
LPEYSVESVGTVYITSDSQEMKVDLPDGRINVSDFIIADSVDANGILTVGEKTLNKYFDNIFYYVKGENILRKCAATEIAGEVTSVAWTKIGDLTALSGAVDTLTGRVDSAEEKITALENKDAEIESDIDDINNVINITSEITATVDVGNYKKGTPIPLGEDGKIDLQEFIIGMLSKDENPVKTLPTIEVTFTNGGAKEAGTKLSPSYKITPTDGKYTANGKVQQANVDWSNYKAVRGSGDAAVTIEGQTGTFAEIQVTDRNAQNGKASFSYSINASADYSGADTAKTYLGKDYPSETIADGTATDASPSITSYRNCFYGTFTTKKDLTSDNLRNSGLSTKQNVSSSTGEFNMTIPVNTLRAVVAYPAESTGLTTRTELNSVKDANASDAQINTAFTYIDTVSVAGAEGYAPIPYKIFYKDWSEPVTAANTYKIKL